jgi:transitional endoplasmic reticulum ATPase
MLFPSSVSSLIIFASIEIVKPKFANLLKDQIDILRKQLDKSLKSLNILSHRGEYQSGPHDIDPTRPPTSDQRDIRTLLDALSDCTTRIGIDAARHRIYESGGEISGNGSNRDIRALLDAVSDSLASLDLPSLRPYESAPPLRRHALEDSGNEEGKNFRALLDRMTTQKNINILADRPHPPLPPPKEYNPSTLGPGNRHLGAPTSSSSQPISLPTLKDRNNKPNAGVIYE